ncbi:hypothetical protein MFFC18_25350 [Mariniblastus fucicola]|uniref:Lactonase, 7-bladed beta-propeller n=1 Tax=Mariniblastus fucicola TaxID=980251 RepID=A0A5B9PCL4_9BACT|nr:hypothetical protein MFFC18_25350 [Mariniblastus fucicola]
MGHSASLASLASARTLTRLFWQDRDGATMYVADLVQNGVTFEVDQARIKEFPPVSPEENDLVQMVVVRGQLVVGVRDHENGERHSGWLEINTGVEEEDHGDHSHWHYSSDATVTSAKLDTQQGNPAHVYRYGNSVYIANDKNNGFTQINPLNGSSRFFTGGGGHITMAAVNDRIAYSTWIDRNGDNKGRVDVVNLRNQKTEPAYSFNLPFGGIHGAGACGNRVYFAPAHGVCWVNCDFDFAETADTVKINHLSLDEDPTGTDYRTGAFTSFRDHMLCIASSKSGKPALCVINATAPNPEVTRIPCDNFDEGMKLSTVKATTVSGNKNFAFAFAEGAGLAEKLLVFELDPNGDRNFSDAKLVNAIEVGASKLEGHFGHHGIAFVGDGKTAVVSNPGDGTLSVIDLVHQKVHQTIEVGGQPTHITNYGEAM